jgi:hypothetical protein
LQKKVSPTNLVVALTAEQLANKTTVVSVVVAVATATNNAKCILQLAQLAAPKPKFLSVRAATVLFIAETASAKTTPDATKTSETPLVNRGVFLLQRKASPKTWHKPRLFFTSSGRLLG